MKKHTCFRIKFVKALSLLLIFPMMNAISASDYDRAFVQENIDNLSIQALSPYKNPEGVEYWPICTSKNNQPRYVSGTNPHQGTDLSINVGEYVYPIFDGEITYIKRDETSQLGHIVVKSQVNSKEPVYIEYLHIIPIDGIDVGDYVYSCIPIAIIDEYKKYDSHLHIGRINAERNLHYQFFDLFTDVARWKNGSDLDVFSYADFNTETNVFSITAYVSSDTENTNYYGGYGRFPMKNITFYYSINSNAWKSFNITQHDLNFRYSFNIKDMTGAKSNDTLKYYITGTRDNQSLLDTTFNEASYTIAYYPAYYAHPSSTLTKEQADRISLSVTIK